MTCRVATAAPRRLDPEVTETVNGPAHWGWDVTTGDAATARPDVAVVGAGRAGSALAVALMSAGYRLTAICSRDPADSTELAARVGARALATPLEAAQAAALIFLTVPDEAIPELAACLAAELATGPAPAGALAGHGVVHCSAAVGLGALTPLRAAGAAIGCLHPLQALAGQASAPLLRGSLMLVEADPTLVDPLRRLVGDLDGRLVTLPSGARPLYHAAAVMAGNGSLALLAAASELLVQAGLPAPEAERGAIDLMEGALSNARRAGARAALTGPVARGDASTVARHLAVLSGRPEAGALYRALARETLRLAGAEGREEIARLLDDAVELSRR